MGSRTPCFLVGAANARHSVYPILPVCRNDVSRNRVVLYRDLRKWLQAQVKRGAGYGHSIREPILAAMTRALEPKLSRNGIITGIYKTLQVDTGSIVGDKFAIIQRPVYRLRYCQNLGFRG